MRFVWVPKMGLLILGGIGLGAWLIKGPFSHLDEQARGGIFLLCFALGWGSITLLSTRFAGQVHWWPLIPASLMAVTGGVLLAGSLAPQVLVFIESAWPFGLVALGLYLLFGRSRPNTW